VVVSNQNPQLHGLPSRQIYFYRTILQLQPG
jgi:hypothetical protein